MKISEYVGQRTEDRGRKTEDGKQKTQSRLQTVDSRQSIVYRLPSTVYVFFTLWLLPSVLCPLTANAEQKNWNALGDKSSWSDDANWYTAGTPAASDDALVDILNASVDISKTFHAKSITLGGKKASTMTVEGFTTGDVKPGTSSDDAFYNRKNGLLVLKGSSGKMTLKGTYEDSREEVPEEPSFMFYVQ